MYAEADEEPLFRNLKGEYLNGNGYRKNPYGFVPFVHRYSGWGKDTSTKSPELLAFSRIRMIRDMIQEDSTMRSDFQYNIHKFAHRAKTLINKTGKSVGEDAFIEYSDAPDAITEIVLPPGDSSFNVEESQVFEAPVFAYHDRIKADLAGEYPMPLRGVATGTSGRQEDILAGHGLALYDCALQNTNTEWADAFDMAIKICYKIPGILPPGLKQDDNGSYSEITVDSKREDPTELSRRAADGDRKYQLGIIDHETNLIDYQGYTKEQAQNIMANILVDDVTRNDPIIRQIMGQTLAREIGMEDEYNALAMQAQQMEKGINPPPQYGERGGQQREGNIQTQLGREMSDMGERRPTRLSPRV